MNKFLFGFCSTAIFICVGAQASECTAPELGFDGTYGMQNINPQNWHKGDSLYTQFGTRANISNGEFGTMTTFAERTDKILTLRFTTRRAKNDTIFEDLIAKYDLEKPNAIPKIFDLNGKEIAYIPGRPQNESCVIRKRRLEDLPWANTRPLQFTKFEQIDRAGNSTYLYVWVPTQPNSLVKVIQVVRLNDGEGVPTPGDGATGYPNTMVGMWGFLVSNITQGH